jgi:cell division protein FtsW
MIRSLLKNNIIEKKINSTLGLFRSSELKNKNRYNSSIIQKSQKFKREYFIDWPLLAQIILIVLFGLAFLSSALSTSGLQNYYTEFFKQLFFASWIGGSICFVLARIDYHVWIKHYKKFYFLTIAPLLFLLIFIIIQNVFNLNAKQIISLVRFSPIKPYESNGALRWISVSFLPTIQPAEIAKLFLLLYLSGAIYFKSIAQKGYTRIAKTVKEFKIRWQDIRQEIFLISICYLFILVQPDLGSVIISVIILATALWNANIDAKLLSKFILSVSIVGAISITALSYRSARVATFFDFYTDPIGACSGSKGAGANFQVCQIRQAISSGGLFGKGFGESQAKKNNLIPEISTDAILAVIGEEAGFIGIMILLILYLGLFLKGMEIAKNAPDIAGKTIASGIAIWILSQAFINVAGVTGLIPLKGAPLPFISEGGSAIILNLMSLGVLLNISSQRKNNYIKNKDLNYT